MGDLRFQIGALQATARRVLPAVKSAVSKYFHTKPNLSPGSQRNVTYDLYLLELQVCRI